MSRRNDFAAPFWFACAFEGSNLNNHIGGSVGEPNLTKEVLPVFVF